MRGSYGPEIQASGSDTGTVSRWPFMTSVGPSSLPMLMTTLGWAEFLVKTSYGSPLRSHQPVTKAMMAASVPVGDGIAIRSLAIATISSRLSRPFDSAANMWSFQIAGRPRSAAIHGDLSPDTTDRHEWRHYDQCSVCDAH
jgi:hypothetical protein